MESNNLEGIIHVKSVSKSHGFSKVEGGGGYGLAKEFCFEGGGTSIHSKHETARSR